MINFRFHLISIVAIFLALTIGIVMGATVIDQGIVDRLNGRITAVSNRAEERRRANEALAQDVGRLNEVVGEAQPYTVEDRLAGVSIVVMAVRGIDPAVVESQVETLSEAGAVAPAVVWLEESWSLEGDRAGALAAALGQSSGGPAELQAAAWTALALRLGSGEESPADGLDASAAQPVDPLRALSEAGFLEIQSLGAEPIVPANFPGPAARVVLLTGTGAPSGTGNLVRVGAEALDAAGVPTVVGEIYGGDDATRGALLEPIRNAAIAATLVSTVDDVEVPEGRIAVVLAAADLGRAPPVVGHYGYGDGAQRALPVFPARP
ncbi:MAG TPA: copper transporter [Acidimicrobiia bacterium]|nr:copper transporter [Acidimicrobiia bacterium]